MAEIGTKEKTVTVKPKELPVPSPVKLPDLAPKEPELVPA